MWLVLAYSLPTKSKTARVTLWRRIGRLGAISPTTGIYVLPLREECLESFQWLRQEVRQAKGESALMRVEQFDGLPDKDLIDMFNRARMTEYRELGTVATQLEKRVRAKPDQDRYALRDELEKLRKQLAEVRRIDYFDSSEGANMVTQLDQIAQLFAPSSKPRSERALKVSDYVGKQWVTRPRPHVDRLACAWLIRRFIDPNAAIRYSHEPEANEITFDMEGAQFGHQGNQCTFETLLAAFALYEPGLRVLAEIVHEIDLQDGEYSQPETAGIDAILAGWQQAGLSDADLERQGIELFEGVYRALSRRVNALAKAPQERKRRNRSKRNKAS